MGYSVNQLGLASLKKDDMTIVLHVTLTMGKGAVLAMMEANPSISVHLVTDISW